MRFKPSLRPVPNRAAILVAGRGIFYMAALVVIGASALQLPAYAQSIVAGSGTQATAPSQQGTIDIEFADASVADILTSVAGMSNVNILVAPDVDVNLRNVKLHDRTVEQAIQLVCSAANLSWRKEQGAYIVSKMPVASNGGAISPSIQGPASTAFPVPGLSTGNGAQGSDLSSLGIPDIAGAAGSASKDKDVRMITLRNVKPTVMAFWLDPARHPEPTELKQARERQANANDINNPRSMQEDEKARAAELQAKLANTYGQFAPPVGAPNGYLPFTNPYNPYANPYAPMAPYTQFSNQFGGGGNNNQNNNRGNNNQNNNNTNGGSGGSSLSSADGVIALPAGIDNIIAIDPQNAILIQGSGEGLEVIENIIAYLDRPVQQVEIEAQFVQLEEGQGRALGLDFNATNQAGETGLTIDTNPGGGTNTGLATGTDAPGTIAIGFAGKKFTASLNALIAKDLAKIVNSPRITTFNNMSAQLRSVNTTRIITLQTNVTNGGGGNPPTQTVTQIVTPITTGVVLTVTPTIHRDGTITMTIQPFVSTQNFVAGRVFPDLNTQEISTSANVKDGDTLAIGGLRVKTASEADRRVPLIHKIPILGPLLFRSKSNIVRERELIIFLTARIVRRTEEPVPGV